MFDDFVADVRCPSCSVLARENIGMQTYLYSEGATFAVGHVFEPGTFKIDRLRGASYLPVSPPAVEDTLRLLETWICPSCAKEQWALVEIVDRRLVGIEGVSMSRETLQRANYIEEHEAEYLAERLTGIDLDELRSRKVDIVAALREALRGAG